MGNSKEIIAIDLDDVVVETAPQILRNYDEKYGIKVPLKDFYSRDYQNVWGVPDGKMAVKRVNEYLNSADYHGSLPIQEATDAIRLLKKRYELYIVTGRPSFIEKSTLQWLKRYFPDIFENIIFTNYFMSEGSNKTVRSKGDVCLEIGATTLIDDNLDHAMSVAGAGLDVLLFGDYPWNQIDKLPDGVRRVEGWKAVLEYFDAKG